MRDKFLDGNHIIEDAILDYYNEPNDESIQQDVIQMIRRRMNEDGHFVLPITTTDGDLANGFTWNCMNGNDGTYAFVVFTSKEEAEKGPESEMMSYDIEAAVEMIINQDETVAGMLINAFDRKYLVTKDELRQMLDDVNREGDGKRLHVHKGDITTFEVDAIVNAANKSLLGGGGVDGAIHGAAGPELLKECRTLGGCETGKAKITNGYRLPAKYIIHTVGPIYSGSETDADYLSACYRNSLDLARLNGLHSIAFPSISTGVYSYPLEEAVVIALGSIYDWLEQNVDYAMQVEFVCFDDNTFECYDTMARMMHAYSVSDKYLFAQAVQNRIPAKKDDWKTKPMPECKVTFSIKHHLSEKDKTILSLGNVPKEMEDKWFWYVEADKLYAHRSWTGNCIYIIDLNSEDDMLTVTVNHNMDEHQWERLDYIIEDLHSLLDWWVQPTYDYYNEWLYETAKAISRGNNTAEDEETDNNVPSQQKQEKVPAVKKLTKKEKLKKIEGKTFYIKRDAFTAKGAVVEEGFIVYQGSGVTPVLSGEMPEVALKMREECSEKGIFDENYILQEDVVLSSASAAASFVVGYTVSGPTYWKTAKGKMLKEYL